ncbi:MAG TPA: helix-turn-helix transcriptional regulator [Pseudomonadales bacterium]|nr:helix-turn-helix transcriptional regulator [Pseudomonadales bacterium]
MKLRNVTASNHSKEFLVVTRGGREYAFPFSRTVPAPTAADALKDVFVDKELASEGFTYTLRSGAQGSVHIEQVLEYNEDPGYLADLLTYRLSLEARRRLATSDLSRRHVAKRLGTSVPQLYRLIDPSNTTKSMKQLIALLHVLGCNVDVVVRPHDAA